jgi:hypothetical protein
MWPSEFFLQAPIRPDSPVANAALEIPESLIHLPVIAVQQVRLPYFARPAVTTGTTTPHGVEIA